MKYGNESMRDVVKALKSSKKRKELSDFHSSAIKEEGSEKEGEQEEETFNEEEQE